MNAETCPSADRGAGQAAAAETSHPDYEVLGEIGCGAHATIYEGYDLNLNRRVAIKQYEAAFRSDPRLHELFLDEARFFAEIDHENMVRIFGMDAQRGWIVMELMQSSLAEVQAKGPLAAEPVRSMLQQILRALELLHRQGKLHGEIRPGKILVDEHGRMKLAPSPGSLAQGEFRLPASGQRHVAPEILNPRQFGEPGPAADLYCLGMTALELLAGSAFEGLFKGVSRGAINEELVWVQWHSSALETLGPVEQLLPKVPADLARVINRLVKKPVAERYASAAEALVDLGEATPATQSAPARAADADEGRFSGAGAVPIGQAPPLYRPAGAGSGQARTPAAALAGPFSRPWWAKRAKNPVALCAALVVAAAALATVASELCAEPAASNVNLEIKSVPPGATLHVDHKELGHTDRSVTLKADTEYLVEVELRGYERVRRTIEVGRAPQTVEFKLKRLPTPPAVRRVVVTTEPDSAAICVDKVEKGKGRATVVLGLGEHEVALSAEGYEDQCNAIRVGDGDSTFHFKLVPRQYRVALHVQTAEAVVYLEGRRIPGPPFETTRAPGTYKLVALQGDSARVEREIRIVDHDVVEVIDFPRKPRVWVQVVTQPAGAVLSYDDDGKPMSGSTPAIIGLSEGLHPVTVSLPGYTTLQSVLPVGGEGSRFQFTLKPAG